MARWLGHAQRLGQTGSQEYFDNEAIGLTAPLLHAAANTPDKTIVDVYRWILARETDEPETVLAAISADDALSRLRNVYQYTERQRDGIIGTAKVQLDAYGHPAATRTRPSAHRRHPRTAARRPSGQHALHRGRARAPGVARPARGHPHLVAALLRRPAREPHRPRVMAAGAVRARRDGQHRPAARPPADPFHRRSAGVQFLTVWQNISQMRERYGPDAANAILALSEVKVLLGSITDHHTRQELVELVGQRQPAAGDVSRGRPPDVLTAQALQRLGAGEGLLVHGDLPPVFFRQRRSYADRRLQRLATGGGQNTLPSTSAPAA